jgi:hypothetical protein
MAILAVAAIAAAPAQAHTPKPKPKPVGCSHAQVGFDASGTLVSQTLTQSAGAATPTRSDDRYSGTITVQVKRANHRAPVGTQTYTLDNDRVRYYDANGDGTADAPKAGDRVKLHGTITHPRKACPITVDARRVVFKAS